MRLARSLLLCAALLFPLSAQAAAVTWASSGDRSTTGTCSGASMDAPTLVTEGLSLGNQTAPIVRSLSVAYEATSGNLTVGGKLFAYVWIPTSASENKWHRATDLDLTVGTAAGTAVWLGLDIPPAYLGMRVAWVPSSIGQAGKVYLLGAR